MQYKRVSIQFWSSSIPHHVKRCLSMENNSKIKQHISQRLKRQCLKVYKWMTFLSVRSHISSSKMLMHFILFDFSYFISLNNSSVWIRIFCLIAAVNRVLIFSSRLFSIHLLRLKVLYVLRWMIEWSQKSEVDPKSLKL